jgi:ArsR family transcriptional regulator, arsenate/arsenite/antimonite-responsive transcriptional repressor
MQVSLTVDISGNMDEKNLIQALHALAQPTRLAAYRDVLASGPEGLAAGEIARRCSVPHNTMSAHLAVLTTAALLRAHRHGRIKTFHADGERFAELLNSLIVYCCDDHGQMRDLVLRRQRVSKRSSSLS